MPSSHTPRKGSLAFGPRKRTTDSVPRFNSWPESDGQPTLQGFAGYKAGMSHVIMINDEADSSRAGMEETVPVTILETPPIHAVALRGYESTPYGERPITDIWSDTIHGDLSRTLSIPTDIDRDDAEATLREAAENGRLSDLRVVTHTDPGAVQSIPSKRPAVMENRIGGGSMDERLDFGLETLDTEGAYDLPDLFRAGEYVDVCGITKGKGTQGPVKRWGVQKRKGKHARQGYRRRIGNLGPWNPSRVRSTVPQQGQTGYHQRTELNKRLIAVGDGTDVNPDGGFVNYGEVNGPYALIKGSVPGPEKRLIRLRQAIRPTRQPRLDPEVRYVSTTSNQG